MTNSTPPNVGTVVKNPRYRQIIYSVYVAYVILVGAVAAYFLGIQEPIPTPVLGVQGVAAYLGLAVGGLAIANTPAKQ